MFACLHPCLLDVRESADGSFYVPNLSKHIVQSRDELLTLVHRGSAARYTSATIMNEHSSRSHSMLTFYIERAVGPENEPETRTIIAAKLNMVSQKPHCATTQHHMG